VGLFEDMKKSAEMSADAPVVVPADRIDLVATDPVSGKPLRRTDYAGTVWYGGRPEFVGKHPLPGDGAAQIKAPFWLPDSLSYAADTTGDVRIQATAAVQGGLATSSGGNFQILEVVGALGENPQGAGELKVFVAVTAVASLPFGVAYRVSVTCPG
jgi:hypothetical protein